MKILYGVQGTGNGHISRARIMAKQFSTMDADVDYLFSGRPPEKYFDMQVFGDYRTRTGISFISANGKVKHLETLRQLKLNQFVQDVKSLDVSSYDLIINDFEPISAWAAKRQKVPCMSVSHQASFLRPIPSKGMSLVDKAILRHFAPSDIQLGVHWYHFGYNIIPPFIEPMAESELLNSSSRRILVYLPFESLEFVTSILTGLSDYEFCCYHPDAEHLELDNIIFKPLSRETFKYDLATAKAVIANAGFELSSECITYGKQLLLKPLSGQFEQSSNAHTLALLGLADVIDDLDMDAIESWLQKSYSGKVRFPSNPQPFAEWILKGEWDNIQPLKDKLWSQVDFPQAVSDHLARIKAA
ncbi:glycosyltransferase [Saccharobesus litoralis]|uniref:Glycosyltransferase n=1 Tax=Saccharobesus litoralis TaxID=2172099 RepID=A0A2S0VR53_9ALTE|nr:MJ1255/VC2487 family glycosyltransferase [Saccharobesus litoralis]AWB66560.1 glycosyltransferase [Saccharobesus litoralis]